MLKIISCVAYAKKFTLLNHLQVHRTSSPIIYETNGWPVQGHSLLTEVNMPVPASAIKLNYSFLDLRTAFLVA
jgi:hypothetical protein